MTTVISDGISAIRGLGEAAWRYPGLLLGVPTVVAVITVVAVLIAPRRYSADITFLYESASSMELPSAVMGLVSQLNLGRLKSSESPQFYADLVTSRPVLDELLLSRPNATCGAPPGSRLLDILHVSGRSAADSMFQGRQRLMARLKPQVDLRTSVVGVTVQAACPALAVELADSIIAALNNFNIRTRQSSAKARRIFAEQRVEEADSTLRAAENALESFLQRNRMFGSPDLQFQHARLQRRVNHWQDISTNLRRQYESARIEEVNSTPVLTIVQPPAIPIRHSSPKRRLIVTLCTLFAAIVGAGAAVIRTLTGPLPPNASPRLRELYQWAHARSDQPAGHGQGA